MTAKLKRLKANKHMLYILKDAKPSLRKELLRKANPEIIKTICEISHNTLKGNSKLSSKGKKILEKYKNKLRILNSSKKSLKSKKKLIIQSGGFLPALLGVVLSGVIGHFLNK